MKEKLDPYGTVNIITILSPPKEPEIHNEITKVVKEEEKNRTN